MHHRVRHFYAGWKTVKKNAAGFLRLTMSDLFICKAIVSRHRVSNSSGFAS